YSLFLLHTTATNAVYTLSLHDALPIWRVSVERWRQVEGNQVLCVDPKIQQPEVSKSSDEQAGADQEQQRDGDLRDNECLSEPHTDRKSTRLNSSHLGISYAVFCLKKKK